MHDAIRTVLISAGINTRVVLLDQSGSTDVLTAVLALSVSLKVSYEAAGSEINTQLTEVAVRRRRTGIAGLRMP